MRSRFLLALLAIFVASSDLRADQYANPSGAITPGAVLELGTTAKQSAGPITAANPLPVTPFLAYPADATVLTASSGNVANGSAAATLGAASGKTTYITGFQITASGATGAAVVTVTVTGTLGGTMSYTFVAPAGATAQATPLVVTFPHPVPASATNTAVVVTLPALGSGNTNATVSAQGFRI